VFLEFFGRSKPSRASNSAPTASGLITVRKRRMLFRFPFLTGTTTAMQRLCKFQKTTLAVTITSLTPFLFSAMNAKHQRYAFRSIFATHPSFSLAS